MHRAKYHCSPACTQSGKAGFRGEEQLSGQRVFSRRGGQALSGMLSRKGLPQNSQFILHRKPPKFTPSHTSGWLSCCSSPPPQSPRPLSTLLPPRQLCTNIYIVLLGLRRHHTQEQEAPSRYCPGPGALKRKHPSVLTDRKPLAAQCSPPWGIWKKSLSRDRKLEAGPTRNYHLPQAPGSARS